MRIFYYGWIIAGVLSLSWGISVGPRQAFPVFLLAFLKEFGTSRGVTAAIFSVHMGFYALGGWGLGVLVDRFGPRRVIVWSTAAWVLTLLLSGLAQNLWQLYLIYGVIGGVATSGLAYVPNNALISRWFIRYRGKATGISQAGVPLGAALFGPLAQLGVATFGWRWTHTGFGLLVAATALPLLAAFLRDDPGEKGLTPDGIPPDAPGRLSAASSPPQVEGYAGWGLPPGYWTVFAANILRGMTMYAISIHQVVFLVDAGFSRMAAASFFSLGSLLAVPGGLAAGALSDRTGRPRAYAGIAALYVIAYCSLLLVHDTTPVAFLSIFILAGGLAMGGITPVFAAFLTDRLQGPHLGYLLGLQNIGYGIGAVFGPLLAGALFDWLGGYATAFGLMAVAAIASSAIVSTVGRPGIARR
jgi:MFS family permease